MKNKDTILQEGEKRRREIYEIKGKAYDDYVKDMKTLKESLRKADGRSDEYKGLYNAIKAASELGEKTKDMSPSKKAEAFRQANIGVIYAVQKYVKGKEKKRFQDKGNDAFDNSMDALSIVSKYTKKEGQMVNEKVDRVIRDINKIRKDDNLEQINKFEQKYGAERAKKAADKRMEKAAGKSAAALK